jgi:hypothetical protein
MALSLLLGRSRHLLRAFLRYWPPLVRQLSGGTGSTFQGLRFLKPISEGNRIQPGPSANLAQRSRLRRNLAAQSRFPGLSDRITDSAGLTRQISKGR